MGGHLRLQEDSGCHLLRHTSSAQLRILPSLRPVGVSHDKSGRASGQRGKAQQALDLANLSRFAEGNGSRPPHSFQQSRELSRECGAHRGKGSEGSDLPETSIKLSVVTKVHSEHRPDMPQAYRSQDGPILKCETINDCVKIIEAY